MKMLFYNMKNKIKIIYRLKIYVYLTVFHA